MRLLSAHYSDGVYQNKGLNLPNSRRISNTVSRGPTGHLSVLNRTVLSLFFGEFFFLFFILVNNFSGFILLKYWIVFYSHKTAITFLVAIRFSRNV